MADDASALSIVTAVCGAPEGEGEEKEGDEACGGGADGADRLWTLEELRSSRQLLTAIHGKVYDLTAFAEKHPGGLQPLQKAAFGKDGTRGFECVGHSSRARRAMARLCVGTLLPAAACDEEA